jgi:aspartate aminotransferase-like enzyme
VWRIGLMGFNSRAENVILLLEAMKRALEVMS